MSRGDNILASTSVNNTGRPDIYVADDSTPSYLYRNDGNGKFTEMGLESGTAVNGDGAEQASMGIAIGDYLHTGRPSLYLTTFSGEYDTLYRNDGDWNFQDVSYKSGIALPSLPFVKWGDAFVDLDNDGWLDLIAVSGHVYPQVDALPKSAGYREPKLLHFNQGNGTFCDASTQAGPALQVKRVARGLAVGDLFNDGRRGRGSHRSSSAPQERRDSGTPLGELRACWNEEQSARDWREVKDRRGWHDPNCASPQWWQLSFAKRSARPFRTRISHGD